MAARPDILFLVLDTQRADRLSCYGYDKPTSPNLDAIAADSTRFAQAVSAAQWTVPSHASMFTGLYPSEHTMVQSYSVLPKDLPTLAERLEASGYYTAGFCNNPLVGVINNGLRRGFTSFLNYSGLLTSRPNQAGSHPGLISRYRQWFKGKIATFLNRVQDAFARSDALLALSFTPLMVPLWQTALSFKGNTQKSLEDTANLLIKRTGVQAEQPVFAFVNLMGTHMPYHPPRRYIEQFAPHVLADRKAQTFLQRFNGDVYGWLAPLTGALDDHQKQTLDGMYDAEVAYQDALLGQFFDRLKVSGQLDNTLVIICADHGEHLGEKQYMGHSLSIYNELVRVPLIIRDPQNRLEQGSVVDAVVSTRRLFHTVLAAAGIANERELALDLAHSQDAPQRDYVFAEAIPPQNVVNLMQKRQPELVKEMGCDRVRRAVWMGQHKLIETEGSVAELYDVLEDPTEALDLSAILPENVEVLQDCLQAFADRSDQSLAQAAATRATDYDDPEVRRRLEDLGYLED
ncbi:sulfatase [Leptolyngbya sp. KIOST-1]|uniref:sulfatase n=1 Tax=Leptolyngbya sp. KIOST-1 TaxID=1229172 RepID=UPI000564A1CC|nr:sulfatase [Leptolyngbya sp. KIOST-1]